MFEEPVCKLCQWHGKCKHIKVCGSNELGKKVMDKALNTFNEFLNSLKEIGMVTDTDEWFKAFEKTLKEEEV